MKNRKVIYPTILLISAVMICVIGLSKIVESVWYTTGNKDNQLTVNEEKLQSEEIVFNYPYINFTSLNGEERQLYSSWFGNIEDSILPENKDFTYQQTANKLGEALKYLTGYTEHQKTPMVIELTDSNMFTYEECYTCRHITDGLYIVAYIDITGQFWHLGVETDEIKQSGFFYKNVPAQSISEQLLKTSLQYLQELGVKDTIVGYYTETAGSEKDSDEYSVYIVHLKAEDGSSLCFTLNKEYGLIYYSKYPQSMQTHKEFIPIK